jgi:hypothetical protein
MQHCSKTLAHGYNLQVLKKIAEEVYCCIFVRNLAVLKLLSLGRIIFSSFFGKLEWVRKFVYVNEGMVRCWCWFLDVAGTMRAVEDWAWIYTVNINTAGYEVDEMRLMACALQKSTRTSPCLSHHFKVLWHSAIVNFQKSISLRMLCANSRVFIIFGSGTILVPPEWELVIIIVIWTWSNRSTTTFLDTSILCVQWLHLLVLGDVQDVTMFTFWGGSRGDRHASGLCLLGSLCCVA